MSLRRFALLLVLGIAVGVAVWIPLRGSDAGHDDVSAPAGGASPAVGTSMTPGDAPSGARRTHPSDTGANDKRGARSHRGTPPAARPTGGPSAGQPGTGTEILPQPSTAPSSSTGLPGLEAPRSTTQPLVSTPLPRRATAKGRLAAGYPGVLAPPRGHAIGTSSVSPAGSVLQVGLTASCRRPCNVLEAFRLRLAGRGFTEVSTQAVENRPTASFQRDDDSVTVSVTHRSRTRTGYALFGVLHTKA